MGAVELELTIDDLLQIKVAAANIEIEGARYPEHLQKRVGN